MLYRLEAFGYVIRNLQHAKPDCRIWRSSLELGAITIYMLNALLRRPGQSRTQDILINAACQHVLSESYDSDDDDDDEMTQPILYDRGLYFISDLVLDSGCYRVPATRPISTHALAVLYQQPDLKVIEDKFNPMHPTGMEQQSKPSGTDKPTC
jgi:hypothetical protein